MNIDRRTLALIIASMCGTGSVSLAQDDLTLISLANSGRIGDSEVTTVTSSVADDPAVQKTSASGTLTDLDSNSGSGRISDESTVDEFDNEHPLVSATPTGFSAASYSVASHNSIYDTGASCSSGACPTTSRTVGGSGLGWVDFDTLFWWGRGLNNAPVIVGGASPTVLPSIPLLGGQDNPLGTDMLFGLRTDLGFWLDDCQHYGVGGRAWGILTDGQESIITNGGNSTGIAFFNTSLGIPDVSTVNLDTGAFGANTGTIGVLNELDVFSGELYGRALLIGDSCHRTDLIGGYTFLRLDSGYRLQSIVNDGVTNAPPPVGTVTTVTDQFSTQNIFHGGHIGLSNSMNRGRVGFDLSGKVALGNMQSTSVVAGNFEQVPPPPNAPTTANRGLFAQSSNIGTITQNNFTFIPEVNAKMRYRLGRAQLGVGYTLVLLPEVAMAASQIDTNIDVFNILGTPVAPTPNFNTESYFLHGLDLGLTFQF
jgi:hypothetical protein